MAGLRTKLSGLGSPLCSMVVANSAADRSSTTSTFSPPPIASLSERNTLITVKSFNQHNTCSMTRNDVARLTIRLGEHNIKRHGETEIFETSAARVVRHKTFASETLVKSNKSKDADSCFFSIGMWLSLR